MREEAREGLREGLGRSKGGSEGGASSLPGSREGASSLHGSRERACSQEFGARSPDLGSEGAMEGAREQRKKLVRCFLCSLSRVPSCSLQLPLVGSDVIGSDKILEAMILLDGSSGSVEAMLQHFAGSNLDPASLRILASKIFFCACGSSCALLHSCRAKL